MAMALPPGDAIHQRISRIYSALGSVRGRAESPYFPAADGQVSFEYSTSRNANPAQLDNEIHALVSSIASLKDHFKHWCKLRNQRFDGDVLIDSDRDVAIIHDLWNLDKHAMLSSSRSGLFPRVVNVVSGWFGTSTRESPVSLVLQVRIEKGVPLAGISLSGSSFSGVDGDVVDESGNRLGRLQEIALRAIHAWEQFLANAGVPV